MAYHDYEGPAVDFAERERLVADLGAKDMMILRNHGLIAGAATVAQAFLNIHRLESACQIQVDAMTAGMDNLNLISEAALTATQELLRTQPERGGRNWRAVKRQIDRIDTSYRD